MYILQKATQQPNEVPVMANNALFITFFVLRGCFVLVLFMLFNRLLIRTPSRAYKCQLFTVHQKPDNAGQHDAY